MSLIIISTIFNIVIIASFSLNCNYYLFTINNDKKEEDNNNNLTQLLYQINIKITNLLFTSRYCYCLPVVLLFFKLDKKSSFEVWWVALFDFCSLIIIIFFSFTRNNFAAEFSSTGCNSASLISMIPTAVFGWIAYSPACLAWAKACAWSGQGRSGKFPKPYRIFCSNLYYLSYMLVDVYVYYHRDERKQFHVVVTEQFQLVCNRSKRKAINFFLLFKERVLVREGRAPLVTPMGMNNIKYSRMV